MHKSKKNLISNWSENQLQVVNLKNSGKSRIENRVQGIKQCKKKNYSYKYWKELWGYRIEWHNRKLWY